MAKKAALEVRRELRLLRGECQRLRKVVCRLGALIEAACDEVPLETAQDIDAVFPADDPAEAELAAVHEIVAELVAEGVLAPVVRPDGQVGYGITSAHVCKEGALPDPWEERIAQFLREHAEVTLDQILRECLGFGGGGTQADANRAHRVVREFGWRRVRVQDGQIRRVVYRPRMAAREVGQ